MKLYFSCMVDCALLPHFLKHYTALGVDTFITIITGDEGFVNEFKSRAAGYNVIIDRIAPITSNWTELDPVYTREILDKYCKPDEWIMLADLDEFHVFEPEVDWNLDNYDYVASTMIDRFSADGKLNKIQDDIDLFEQFPVEREYTKETGGCIDKVILTRARNTIHAGHHIVLNEARRYPTVYSTKHFKWHSALKKSLAIRMGEITEAWRVELQKQMDYFNITNWEDYWEEARAYGILQRKREWMKFMAYLDAHCPEFDSFLEVGTAGGGTSFYFNKLFKRGTSIDLTTCWNTEKLQSYNPNWQQWVGNANDFVAEQYDFVFIDGDHSYEGVKKDYLHFRDHCKIMAFHDIVASHPINDLFANVKQFWDEVKTKHKSIEIIDFTPGDCAVEVNEPYKSTIKNKEWGGIGCLIF